MKAVGQYPHLETQWDFDKNIHLNINEITGGSGKIASWICGKGHKWNAQIQPRVKRNVGCPYCSNQKLCIDNCLTTKDHDLAQLFSKELNGGLTASDVIYGSRKKYWWKCPIAHDHIWQAALYAIINNRKKWNKSGCPSCYNKKLSITNSLINYPNLMKEWDYRRNKIFPTEVIAGGKTKFWWRCLIDKKHIWKTTISLRITKKNNCPFCHPGMYDSTWRKWEYLCNKIGIVIYKDELILQPLTRLPNNTVPDLTIRNKNELLIVDVKTNAFIEKIEEDIKNYSPYCDRLEFWCLHKKRESISFEISKRKIDIVFVTPDELLDRILDKNIRNIFKNKIKLIQKTKDFIIETH